jgi:mannose-6-phosphate isomerase-like protein (cupin superfamily)
MADFTHLNLRRDVVDMAARHEMEGVEGHFATRDLGLERSGVSYQRLDPGVRQGFGHRHASQEELYVVVEGSGRAALGDEVVELGVWDALRVPGPTWRCFEAGPDGMAFLALGAPPMKDLQAESEMRPGWWAGDGA